MKIGIAINTHNRSSQCDATIHQIRRFSPDHAMIVVVDDASKTPYRGATYRFSKNVGAPTAKNKSLELLYDAGCTDIFLFDDDTYPKVQNWWRPYVESREPHLNFTFKYPFEIIDGHKSHTNPNGCMMYLHRSVIDRVGGFDTDFKIYGYWHGSFSMRVHNAGMTTKPFMDVLDSEKLFVSLDKLRRIRTSRPDQARYLPANKQRYQDKISSSEYIDFRVPDELHYPKVHYSNPYSADKNIGKVLNDFCAMVPDGDWICLQDGDMMYLTPDWGRQITDAIVRYGDRYALIGCLTNRLGRSIQRHNGVFSNDHDMRRHYQIACELKDSNWSEVKDITSQGYVAGMFMLFPKSTWNRVKFVENTATFDDQFSREVLRKRGRLGLMTGLYVYHLYRIWSDSPVGDKKHLI